MTCLPVSTTLLHPLPLLLLALLLALLSFAPLSLSAGQVISIAICISPSYISRAGISRTHRIS